ncbi:MAG: ABC transporter ATP-binding protein [Candidatus Tectimicrobiota bacterium]
MERRVPLLAIEDLSVEFRTRSGVVRALDQVSLQLGRGETVGIVGESGSGKSVLAFTIMGILDPAARLTQGRLCFGGLDLATADEGAWAEQRGRELAMIFQHPRTALNPIRPVGKQIGDVLLRHANLARADVYQRVLALLEQVKIVDPERCYRAYPFELSGGMCQRVLIAMALACTPSLLIADEPTTGLDVVTQATIMSLISELAVRNRMATLFITHDLALAARYCERLVVMHAGHVVETAPTAVLFRTPRHPYTAKLLAATPQATTRLQDLAAIPGNLPDLRQALPTCRYSARCERYAVACDTAPLPRHELDAGHLVACWSPL